MFPLWQKTDYLNTKPQTTEANHNPKEYNGFKICGLGRDCIFGEEIQELYKFIENGNFETSDNLGKVEDKDLSDVYISYITDRIKLGDKKLKVAFDTGNGAAGIFIKKFAEKLGLENPLFECIEPDGNFPIHHPDPSQEKYMLDFEKFVVDNKCDVGIAYDGDADILMCIDENGKERN